MIVAEDRSTLRAALERLRRERRGPVVLVPTMGNLHRGHLRLVARAREAVQAEVAETPTIVASVFVNPTQFAPGEDYERYPRTFEADRRQLADAGVDVLYGPTVTEIYPHGLAEAVAVRVPGLSEDLCGAGRPGHFDGVATVVTRLFLAALPTHAVFGMKDYQQLLIVERLVADLRLDIEIVRCETVREPDGLAMSSRNGYLSATDRQRAPALYRALTGLRDRMGAGVATGEALAAARAELAAAAIDAEYLTVRRASDLRPPGAEDRDLVALVAAPVGGARLIDNVLFRR